MSLTTKRLRGGGRVVMTTTMTVWVKTMDIIWTRMMMQRSCLLDWMMVGILLIGEGVDIVELGRQDSAAASNERPTRNTKMASRKTKVAEKGHQKRIRHRDDDSVCFSG